MRKGYVNLATQMGCDLKADPRPPAGCDAGRGLLAGYRTRARNNRITRGARGCDVGVCVRTHMYVRVGAQCVGYVWVCAGVTHACAHGYAYGWRTWVRYAGMAHVGTMCVVRACAGYRYSRSTKYVESSYTI